ncbi:MAG: hypothetical protein KGJ66_05310 [Alphaproteobacteria bacterium]|nr:hypothetical protein [Alphaproteobacteria bacterium]
MSDSTESKIGRVIIGYGFKLAVISLLVFIAYQQSQIAKGLVWVMNDDVPVRIISGQ